MDIETLKNEINQINECRIENKKQLAVILPKSIFKGSKKAGQSKQQNNIMHISHQDKPGFPLEPQQWNGDKRHMP